MPERSNGTVSKTVGRLMCHEGSNPSLSANNNLMEITRTFYPKNRKEWRLWLERNAEKENEVWVIYYKKESEKERIPYDDAVEEALCFGWIDTTVKKINDESFAQRFTKRRKTSVLSALNAERVRMLIKNGRMTSRGLEALAHVFDPKNDMNPGVDIPKDIEKALRNDPEVWKNFQHFTDSYKRIRIGYILSQGKHGDEAYEKSLKNFIKNTKMNKTFGMGKEIDV